MKALLTLWRFSRPHTIIGSVISICTLYIIICHGNGSRHLPLLAMALLIGICCNIFIVGINQIADVEIDRINKPYLPIPSGALRIGQAKWIAFSALFISLALALYVSSWLFGIILLSNAIGWAYSMPPFYFKQHYLPATFAIVTVRGIVVNVGGYLVFNYLINNSLDLPWNVKLLTLFIVVFSIAISWFKDLPDMAGDARYHIKTFVILYSSKTALISGHVLVGAAYLFTIVMKLPDVDSSGNHTPQTQVLLYGHLVLFALFIGNGCFIRLDKFESIKKFYKRFWWFFFAEYVLYLVAYSV